MKSKPNIREFLDGAKVEQTPPISPSINPTRITKTIRIAPELEAAIKEAAHQRWRDTGRKTSESDVIEEAIRKYLSM